MAKKKTEKKEELKTAKHRVWMYNKDGGKLFEKGDEIPAGYQDKPVK